MIKSSPFKISPSEKYEMAKSLLLPGLLGTIYVGVVFYCGTQVTEPFKKAFLCDFNCECYGGWELTLSIVGVLAIFLTILSIREFTGSSKEKNFGLEELGGGNIITGIVITTKPDASE